MKPGISLRVCQHGREADARRRPGAARGAGGGRRPGASKRRRQQLAEASARGMQLRKRQRLGYDEDFEDLDVDEDDEVRGHRASCKSHEPCASHCWRSHGYTDSWSEMD